MSVIEHPTLPVLKDYAAIARDISEEFAKTAVERDRLGGSPTIEIARLKESGLLSLVVPKEYGGLGATWAEGLKIVQELSKADGSLGQLYGNHLNLTTLGQVSGTPAQKEKFYRETTQQQLFWANAINTRDTRLTIAPAGNHFLVNGVKGFGTGVTVADRRVFTALHHFTKYLTLIAHLL